MGAGGSSGPAGGPIRAICQVGSVCHCLSTSGKCTIGLKRQKRRQGAGWTVRGRKNMSDAKKLSSMDASFLYLETPEMPMHVGSMAIFRLPENYNGNFFEDFKAMIASRLHVAPILKARLQKAPLDIDHPSWVDVELVV